jgi:hypothetical protein
VAPTGQSFQPRTSPQPIDLHGLQFRPAGCRPSLQALLLNAPVQPRGAHDGAELPKRGLEVLVDDDVIELPGMRDFLARIGQPAQDGGLGVLGAGAQAPLQLRRDGGRMKMLTASGTFARTRCAPW